MFNVDQYSLSSQALSFVALFFSLIALVAAINSLWRSHKMLATFIRFCIIFIIISVLKKILETLGYNQSSNWYFIGQCFDFVRAFFVMMAMIEWYRIIRLLDGETFRTTGLKSSVEVKKKK